MADIAFQNAKDQIEQTIFETKTVIALNRKNRQTIVTAIETQLRYCLTES